MYRKISEKLVNIYPCDWEKNLRMKETCICGVEVVCSTFINILIIIVLACALSKKVEVFIFFTVYGMMRVYSGGIHARNHVRCIFCYTAILLISVYVSGYLANFEMGVYVLVILVPIVTLTINYMYGGKQKEVEELEGKKYEICCRRITIFFNIILIIVCLLQAFGYNNMQLNVRKYFYIQAFAMLFQSVSLFLGKNQCIENSF